MRGLGGGILGHVMGLDHITRVLFSRVTRGIAYAMTSRSYFRLIFDGEHAITAVLGADNDASVYVCQFRYAVAADDHCVIYATRVWGHRDIRPASDNNIAVPAGLMQTIYAVLDDLDTNGIDPKEWFEEEQ